MPNLLTELDVEWVSLVDRAAVRDPKDPTQPQRFLLAKSEVPVWKSDRVSEMDRLMAAVAKAEDERDVALAAMDSIDGEYERLAERLEKLEKARARKNNDGGDEMSRSDEKSQADGAASLAGQNVSAAAQAAIGRAASELEPFAGEDDRVAALISKLRTIADPAGGGAELAKAAMDLERQVGADPSASASDRALVRKAVARVQEHYFAEQSPAAYAVWRGRGETVGVSKSQDSLVAKRDEFRKADPALSEYDALVRAMHENPVLARAYSDSVR